MIEVNDRIIEALKFVVSEIMKICQMKDYGDGNVICTLIMSDLESSNDRKDRTEYIIKIVDRIYDLIDDLKYLIEIEMRYILFPLPDIKKEAYEMGKKYVINFLEWVKPEYSQEKIMEILEDEEFRLQEMRTLLDKLDSKKIVQKT